jgi:hypothetical protein
MAAEALQSLNRILQYQQARERSEVQEALQLMQFAQQKRQIDMQSTAKNLELLSSVNTQFKLKQAQKFAQDTGMSAIYAEYSDGSGGGMKEAVTRLTQTWGRGEEIELDREVATDLVAATWSLYGDAKSPDALINIGSKLSPDKEMTPHSKKYYEGFKKLGYLDMTEGADNTDVMKTFQAMNDALENDTNIMMETKEYVKGDYDIQRDFTFVQRALDTFEKEADELEKTAETLSGDTQVESPFSPDAQVKQSYDLIQSKNKEISGYKQSLAQLAKNISEAKVLKGQGLEISEEWELQLQNQTRVKNDINTKIQLLSDDVRKLTQTNQNLRKGLATSDIRRGEYGPTSVGKFAELATGGWWPYQKLAIWNDTGVWPTDEDLEAWRKASGRTSGTEIEEFTSGDPFLLAPR